MGDTSNDGLVRADGVSLSLQGQRILDKVSLKIAPKQTVALIGPNGSGKSSLVRVLLGLVKPTSGTVVLKEGLTIGYMPQKIHIPETLPITVERFLLCATKDKVKIRATLKEVGLSHRLKAPVQRLSGGELQRLLLARALLREPELLILDEPVQGVDVAGRVDLYQLIARTASERDAAVLMVSHELHLVMGTTEHVVCLNRHVCCSGHPESVSQHPEYMALFGAAQAKDLAIYQHHHDHTHAMTGEVEGPHDG